MTLATWIPAVVTLAALPFGFVEAGIAVVAGVYGLYGVLPAVVAWLLDLYRDRLPRGVQRVLGAVIVVVAVPYFAFWLLWTALFFGLGVPVAAVVVVVGIRLLRARGPHRCSRFASTSRSVPAA